MTKEELTKLRHSDGAPYNHEDYTFWIHDKIIERIRFEIESITEVMPFGTDRRRALENLLNFESLTPCK